MFRKKENGRRANRKRQKEKVSFQEKVSGFLLWTFEILVVILFAFVIVYFFGQIRTNVGQSMDLTLTDGNQVLIDTFSYRIGNPKRNDVIAFKPNGSESAHTNIKRVIGVPGDKVQIVDGIIYINDMPLIEKADYPKILNEGLASEPVNLDVKEYFVLGDNRNNSEDSRHPDIGIVNSDYVEGKVWIRIFPRNQISFIR